MRVIPYARVASGRAARVVQAADLAGHSAAPAKRTVGVVRIRARGSPSQATDSSDAAPRVRARRNRTQRPPRNRVSQGGTKDMPIVAAPNNCPRAFAGPTYSGGAHRC